MFGGHRRPCTQGQLGPQKGGRGKDTRRERGQGLRRRGGLDFGIILKSLCRRNISIVRFV